jgi:hypothetical protein
MIDTAGITAAVVLACLSLLHVAWAFGVRVGATGVIPTVDGASQLSPSSAATSVVALLLATASVLLVGAVLGWGPEVVFSIGSFGVGVVLLARAVGEFRLVGFFKRVRGTEFARRDTWVYSPLCVVLGVSAIAVAIGP